MTSWVVADSGIFLSVALGEAFAAQAEGLMTTWGNTSTQIAVPYLFRYELVSVTRKHIARGNITLEFGQRALTGLLRRPVVTFSNEQLLMRAFSLANQFNQPAAYDSFYLALAEYLGCEFWTGDMKLFNAVSLSLPWVKWIGNFSHSEQ